MLGVRQAWPGAGLLRVPNGSDSMLQFTVTRRSVSGASTVPRCMLGQQCIGSSAFRGTAIRVPLAQSRLSRRAAGPVVAAAMSAKGTKHEAADVQVKRIMGEGSYGQVFEVGPPQRAAETADAVAMLLAAQPPPQFELYART